MKYAGIGSRQTPEDIQVVMQDYAYACAQEFVLRTGGADGADKAFEFGARTGGGLVELFLPWKGFNGCLNNELLSEPTPQAFEVAKHYHPGWGYLKQGARKLIARNSHQVLGRNLDDPVDYIVCWTPDGSLDGSSSKSGGTGQALRIAQDHTGIVVFNLARPDDLGDIKAVIGNDGMFRE